MRSWLTSPGFRVVMAAFSGTTLSIGKQEWRRRHLRACPDKLATAMVMATLTSSWRWHTRKPESSWFLLHAISLARRRRGEPGPTESKTRQAPASWRANLTAMGTRRSSRRRFEAMDRPCWPVLTARPRAARPWQRRWRVPTHRPLAKRCGLHIRSTATTRDGGALCRG